MINSLLLALKLSVNFYKINSLNEMKEFLLLKRIYFNTDITRGSIIIYFDNKINICKVKSICEDKIITNSLIFIKPEYYICISKVSKPDYFNQFLNIVLYLCSIVLSFINIYFSIIILLVIKKLDLNAYRCILTTLVMLLALLYGSFFVMLALILIVISIKFEIVVYLSIIPLLFIGQRYGTNLVFVYAITLINIKQLDYSDKLCSDLLTSKLFVKNILESVETIEIDGVVIKKQGIYFFELSKNSKIYINGINIKFIALENLSEQFKIIYVHNRNSFFTNRRKYSKIEYRDKYIIYLLEVK